MSIKDKLFNKININLINYSLVLKKKSIWPVTSLNLTLGSIKRANTIYEFNIFQFIYVHIKTWKTINNSLVLHFPHKKILFFVHVLLIQACYIGRYELIYSFSLNKKLIYSTFSTWNYLKFLTSCINSNLTRPINKGLLIDIFFEWLL